ncbi:MAG: cob(I)yrinic acid a,c-diamide adenosyltransferase [Chlorobi bacterium]|nr:cob(I)yrinic acid a,c-diamide adenosyltransferase [Chlorobiota bacterium]
MKIYTKKGDSGTTQLIGGTRVPKHHLRTEAYGTLDELTAMLGVLYDRLPDKKMKEEITRIQNHLFTLGTFVALDPVKAELKNGKPRLDIPPLKEDHIRWLEERIDAHQSELPPMAHFIIPGGYLPASWAHVCRTVARRAERRLTALHEREPLNPLYLAYINRLSDYLFVLARKLSSLSRAEERKWIP